MILLISLILLAPPSITELNHRMDMLKKDLAKQDMRVSNVKKRKMIIQVSEFNDKFPFTIPPGAKTNKQPVEFLNYRVTLEFDDGTPYDVFHWLMPTEELPTQFIILNPSTIMTPDNILMVSQLLHSM